MAKAHTFVAADEREVRELPGRQRERADRALEHLVNEALRNRLLERSRLRSPCEQQAGCRRSAPPIVRTRGGYSLMAGMCCSLACACARDKSAAIPAAFCFSPGAARVAARGREEAPGPLHGGIRHTKRQGAESALSACGGAMGDVRGMAEAVAHPPRASRAAPFAYEPSDRPPCRPAASSMDGEQTWAGRRPDGAAPRRPAGR